MSIKTMAAVYAAGKLRGDMDNPGWQGRRRVDGVAHHGALIACRANDVPSVEAYDQWLAENQIGKRAHSPVTGSKLRRMAIMRRQGSAYAECGAAVGMSGVSAQRWLLALPAELGA